MPSLLPSLKWRDVVLRLWGMMHPKERVLLLAHLAMPAIGQVAFLGSFMVSLRLIMMAAHGQIPDQWELAAGVGVFVVLAGASLIQMGQEKTAIAMRQTIVRLIRRILARHLLPLRERTDEERVPLLKAYHRVEPFFVNRSTQVLNQILALGAAMLLIGVLLTLLTVLVPPLGLTMIVGGIGLFLYFRYRITHCVPVPAEVTARARKELNELTSDLTSGLEEPNTIATKYEANTFDDLQSRIPRQQLRFNGKLGALISGGGAVLMVAAFFLAGGGYFDGFDPIRLLIFAFALRFVITQSRAALQNWSLLLREREILSLLRQMLLDEQGILGSAPLTLKIPLGPAPTPKQESISAETII